MAGEWTAIAAMHNAALNAAAVVRPLKTATLSPDRDKPNPRCNDRQHLAECGLASLNIHEFGGWQ